MTEREKEYYLYCGIKSGWHIKSLGDYSNDPTALSKVKKYLRNYSDAVKEGVGLYLWGANGTGKTHLMNCAAMDLIGKGMKVRVFAMDEIVDKFTSSWYSEEEKKDLNHVLRYVDFLFIDEFGKNLDKDGNPIYLPDLVKRVMESVLRFRVQMRKPIWFTSNTDPLYVKEVFSEDVASLLNEAVIPVNVRGGDYRKEIQRLNKRKFV